MKEGWRDGIFSYKQSATYIQRKTEQRAIWQVRQWSYFRGVGSSSDCMGGKMTTWPWPTVSFGEAYGQGHLCLQSIPMGGQAAKAVVGHLLKVGAVEEQEWTLSSCAALLGFCFLFFPSRSNGDRTRGGVVLRLGWMAGRWGNFSICVSHLYLPLRDLVMRK